jgi:hypothetical protein
MGMAVRAVSGLLPFLRFEIAMGWRTWDHYETEARERYSWRFFAAVAFVIAALALPFFWAIARAQATEITDKTRCAEMEAAFQMKNLPRIRDFGTYVLNTMDQTDLRHTRAGEPGIMAQLSDSGRANMAVLTSVNCEQNPKMTVYNSAAFVYGGIRDMQLQLETAK